MCEVGLLMGMVPVGRQWNFEACGTVHITQTSPLIRRTAKPHLVHLDRQDVPIGNKLYECSEKGTLHGCETEHPPSVETLYN
jgi:hypothetical protein